MTEALKRDDNGYGILPSFREFHLPEEELAPGAVINGNEIAVVKLIEDVDTEAAREWVGGNNDISAWNPTQPPGDGWYLAMVCEHEEGPFAVWARPAGETKPTGRAYAEEFLLGSLIKAATKHLKTLSKPWCEMKEKEQARVLAYVHNDCREAVRDAIDIISSNARLTFPAAVDQAVFKDGVKVVLTMAKTPEAHSIADAEGSFVTIVIEERSKLLQEGDALTTDPDQKPLFESADSSTEEETA